MLPDYNICYHLLPSLTRWRFLLSSLTFSFWPDSAWAFCLSKASMTTSLLPSITIPSCLIDKLTDASVIHSTLLDYKNICNSNNFPRLLKTQITQQISNFLKLMQYCLHLNLLKSNHYNCHHNYVLQNLWISFQYHLLRSPSWS